jgi:acyl-CoA thioesterase-1
VKNFALFDLASGALGRGCLGLLLAGGLLAPASGVEGVNPVVDWPALARYRTANAALGVPAAGEDRIVFMGDSITQSWGAISTAPARHRTFVNRGISGQTTPQMLLRFRQDVIDLKPRVVVILAGTNDIAGNTGPATPAMIEGNLASMAELARAHGITVVLCSLLPASRYPWNLALRPGENIAALNGWIRDFARRNGFVYLDYYSSMHDGKLGLRRAYSEDGVHPNAAGYAVMLVLAERAIPDRADALAP